METETVVLPASLAPLTETTHPKEDLGASAGLRQVVGLGKLWVWMNRVTLAWTLGVKIQWLQEDWHWTVREDSWELSWVLLVFGYIIEDGDPALNLAIFHQPEPFLSFFLGLGLALRVWICQMS